MCECNLFIFKELAFVQCTKQRGLKHGHFGSLGQARIVKAKCPAFYGLESSDRSLLSFCLWLHQEPASSEPWLASSTSQKREWMLTALAWYMHVT